MRSLCAMDMCRRYLDVVRTLQRTYMLEPAGSHGVWGLDGQSLRDGLVLERAHACLADTDYQFLPYLLGASQLIGHDSLRPAMIGDAGIAHKHAQEYLFFAAIDFIFQVCRRSSVCKPALLWCLWADEAWSLP